MATSAKSKAAESGPSARSPKLRKTRRTRGTESKKAPKIAQPLSGNPPVATVGMLRTEFALNRHTLARMLGVTVTTLAQWEKATAEPNDSDQARIKRVAKILHSHTQVMRPSFIRTWLTNPNASCKALGAETPVDLMERGEYQDIEDSIFFLGSGVAY